MNKEEIEYWGSEENFANHSHCVEELEPIFCLTYVKTLSKRIAELEFRFEHEPSKSYDLGFQKGVETQSERIKQLQAENDHMKKLLAKYAENE